MVVLKGWKYAAFLGVVTGTICLALYPVIVQPMINPDKYKRIREDAAIQRKRKVDESIQK